MQKLLSLALVCALLPSCASVVSKSEYPVKLKSAGAPVKFTVKNSTGSVVNRGVTPKNVTLSASEGFFKPAKYTVNTKSGSQPLNASMDGWFAGNLFIGGVLGAAVDGATGNMWKLPKEKVID